LVANVIRGKQPPNWDKAICILMIATHQRFIAAHEIGSSSLRAVSFFIHH
jgi:hypothetical protein